MNDVLNDLNVNAYIQKTGNRIAKKTKEKI